MIYKDPKTKDMLVLSGQECTHCKNSLMPGMVAIYKINHFRDYRINTSVYCETCIPLIDMNPRLFNMELYTCFVIDNLPTYAIPVYETPLTLSLGKISGTEATNLDSEITIDRTRYAGRESFHGCQIGCDSEVINRDKVLIENKEQALAFIGVSTNE